MFLIDEISLADDSVLERLNSVLEPERTLLLAEKGGDGGREVEAVVGKDGFQVFSTMNPGGDFGKKEVTSLTNRRDRIYYINYTVKHGYSDHAYKKLMLTVQ